VRKSIRYVAAPLGLAVAAALAAVGASVAAIQQNNVVTAVPSTATPNIVDGTAIAITRVGTKMIVGGSFTQVEDQGSNTAQSRPFILAFDSTNGQVDQTFVPSVNGEVWALQPGPTPDTVYVGGKFTTVNGVNHRDLVMLNTTDGSVVTSFAPPAFNGAVNTIAVTSTRVLVGGIFSTIGTSTRNGLASLDKNTGALDTFLTVSLAGHHSWNGSGAKASVGASSMRVSPDGSKLVVIGNFKTADTLDRDQGVMIDLTGATATVSNWETNTLKATCSANAFDSWVRDIDFSPDGSYFVIVGTGGPHLGQACDSAMRYETNATGSGLTPTWIDFTGGDTLLSVAITGPAVYVGGHQRWLNNSFGTDSAKAGAVARPGLGALDPLTGVPLTWNPGRNPRGAGADVIFADSDGIYVGSDTDYIGNTHFFRGKIAYFPLTGGYTPVAGATATLPGHVFRAGAPVPLPPILYRVNVAGPVVTATDGGPDWAADNGATNPVRLVNGTVVTLNKTVPKTAPSLPPGTPLDLFNSERDYSSNTPTAWSFPVPSGVQVQVHLFLAQRAWDSANNAPVQRTFSVLVNGSVVEANLNPNVDPGYNTAGMHSYTATSNGAITIGFNPSVGSAQVSAIEITNVSGGTTVGFAKTAYDGTTATPQSPVSGPDATPWGSAKGAFLVDNMLYYGLSDGNLYKRTFDGASFGAASVVNPYSDPNWDGVPTGSGTTTYTGVKSSFYGEITSLTSMFFLNGKLYYTRSGNSSLFWRWFSSDSTIIGADEFTVAGASGFNTVAGVLFVSGSNFYFAKTDGKLYRMGWNGSAPTGTATAVSGPGIDSATWNTPAGFLAH
jgi:hypothetical protein